MKKKEELAFADKPSDKSKLDSGITNTDNYYLGTQIPSWVESVSRCIKEVSGTDKIVFLKEEASSTDEIIDLAKEEEFVSTMGIP